MGKSVAKLLRADVRDSVGVRQTCAGHQGGVEAAIHGAIKTFELESTECMLQIDATNIFNNMNRDLLLHNSRFTCPKIAKLFDQYLPGTSSMVFGKRRQGTTRRQYGNGLYAICMKP